MGEIILARYAFVGFVLILGKNNLRAISFRVKY